MTAAFYCHTSHGSNSHINAREARCRCLARKHGADEIVTVIDRGPCPRAEQHAGIAKLLRMVHSGEVGLVVVDDAARLSRCLSETRAICREVSRSGARLVFVSP